MEREITVSGELFGGIDFNSDVVFEVSPTGEVLDTSVPKKNAVQPKKIKEVIDEDQEESDDKEGIEGQEKPLTIGAPPSPSDPINLFASALFESGAIVADEEKVKAVKTYDDLVEVIKDTIKKNEFADLGDEAKQALQDIRDGVPLQSVKEHYGAQTRLESITEDQFIDSRTDGDDKLEFKQSIRKQLIVQSYLVAGYDKARAEKMAQRSIDIGEDVEDAKAALEDLKRADGRKMDNERANAQARKVETQRQLKNLENVVMSTEEILPGVPISEKLRKQVFDSMTKPIEAGSNGPVFEIQRERSKDPIAFDLRLHYLYALGLFKETPDMSVITRTEKSKAAKQFQDAVKNANFGGGGKQPQIHGATDDDLLESLSSMKF